MQTAAASLPRRRRAIAVACLLLLFALELVHVARVYSANWDEAHHLYDGYNIWTTHDFRVNAEVPPLVKLAAALPLLPMHLRLPPDRSRSPFVVGRDFVFGNGGDRVLLPARLACMLFTLLLAWLIYAAARSMFGTVAALLALALFIFDPLVLAHGTLISTDLGSACFLFASAFAFYRYGLAPGPARLAVVALAAGLAMVTKFTGILVVPILLLLATAEGMLARSLALFGRRLVAVAIALVVSWGILWSFYGLRYAPAPHGMEFSPSLAVYLRSLPNPANARQLALLARIQLLPEPYLWGLANTKITEWAYTSYFFGHVYRHGPWQYFPAAFLIKSTLPLLLLLVLGAVLWLWRDPSRPRSLPYARELCFLLIPVAVYFAVVTASHFDIGARHLLPIYPFLYVLAAAGGILAMRRSPRWAPVVAALLLWQVATSVRVSPAYMAYGNEAWGGPLAVHRYLSDANTDWGQQLKAVKQYIDTNHVTNCWFAYFPDGAVLPEDYGVHCHRLPTANNLGWIRLPVAMPPVVDGTVLLSDGVLESMEWGDGALNPYGPFLNRRPDAVIQGGVNVYRGRFALPLAAALTRVSDSADRAKAGDQTAALALAQQAVDLAPWSAATQLNLAQRLADQGQWQLALPHFEVAQVAVTTVRPDLQPAAFAPAIAAGLVEARQHTPAR